MESRLVGERAVHLGCCAVQLLNHLNPQTATLPPTRKLPA